MAALANPIRFPVFGYGSNGIEQLRVRCQNPNLKSFKAHMKDHVRIFSGRAVSRQNGAVASIAPMQGGNVYGSVVFLTQAEMHLLDVREGVISSNPTDTSTNRAYRRVQVTVWVGNVKRQDCYTYIRNKKLWVTGGGANFNGKPSPQYLTRIKNHVEEHWTDPAGVTITIRKPNLEIVEEWSVSTNIILWFFLL